MDEKQLKDYLHGDTFATNLKGYVGIIYKGLTIGYGKAVNNIIKNNLPKGLRK
ncbi:MAG: hypothetical protein LBM99_06340 [Bacillales bacterium]|nr:hypothetical protein [Bacillales bacterium]